MIAFWVMAGVLSAALAVLILARAARAAAQAEPADPSPILYRRQIAEIAELADRGLIGANERKGAETEAARRLLAATEHPAETWSPGLSGRKPVLVAAIAAPALALGLYLMLGAPGMADQPFAGRLDHWLKQNPQDLTPPEMAAVLDHLTKTRPNDPEGFRYLALADGAAGDAGGAVRALRHAVRLAPQRADLWEMLGDALVFQGGGKVSADAKEAFAETLARDPTNATARFHLARARIDAGDKAGGLADWKALLAEMPANDPRVPALKSAIAEAEGTPQPPPMLSGDPMTAIRGMVAGLAEKLKANPNDPGGWVQLVRAYSVLGETDKRDAALKDARARYGNHPDVLDALAKAAAAEPMR
jgi:cytochrome c-type biogenesis protein CcmH